MKLGKDTGSLVNAMMCGTNGQPEPVVGMGMTFLSWTDRSPGTITSVQHVGERLLIGVKSDHFERADSNKMSESQDYNFSPNPAAREQFWRLDSGTWRSVIKKDVKGKGRFVLSGGTLTIRIGERDRYYDFSF